MTLQTPSTNGISKGENSTTDKKKRRGYQEGKTNLSPQKQSRLQGRGRKLREKEGNTLPRRGPEEKKGPLAQHTPAKGEQARTKMNMARHEKKIGGGSKN